MNKEGFLNKLNGNNNHQKRMNKKVILNKWK